MYTIHKKYRKDDFMDIRELQYFVTIVQEGNISKAAKTLNISQPPLSHAIKLLEEELNTKLFIRGSRNITLTETGKVLYSKALNLIELHKQSIKEINDIEKNVRGNIAFGCISSAHMFLLEKGVLPFYLKNPQVSYELYEKNTYELIELINANLIDFALVRNPFLSTDLIVEKLQDEKLVAVYNQKQYTFNKEKISLNDLKDKPLIFYRRFYSVLESIFQKKLIVPKIVCKCDDARSAILWASKKMGITIVPYSATKYITDRNTKFIEIKDLDINSDMAIIYKKNHYLSNSAKALIQTIKDNL